MKNLLMNQDLESFQGEDRMQIEDLFEYSSEGAVFVALDGLKFSPLSLDFNDDDVHTSLVEKIVSARLSQDITPVVLLPEKDVPLEDYISCVRLMIVRDFLKEYCERQELIKEKSEEVFQYILNEFLDDREFLEVYCSMSESIQDYFINSTVLDVMYRKNSFEVLCRDAKYGKQFTDNNRLNEVLSKHGASGYVLLYVIAFNLLCHNRQDIVLPSHLNFNPEILPINKDGYDLEIIDDKGVRHPITVLSLCSEEDSWKKWKDVPVYYTQLNDENKISIVHVNP